MWRRGSGSIFRVFGAVKNRPATVAGVLLFAASLSLTGPAKSQETQRGEPAPRVVNVTSDSETGWVPSVELEGQALAAVAAFYAALERGDDAAVYGMMDGLLKVDLPEDQSTDENKAFRKLAGATVSRRFNQVTWTKDSPSAPQPGVYVALDITAKYEKVARFCGYIVLHQSDASAPFLVSRVESNYIANSDVASMSSPAQAQSMWKRLSANCPNYRPLELEEAETLTTGYSSVAEALAGLHSQPGVKFEDRNGWTIAVDEKAFTIWSFSPPDYPAYPAVVKREVVSDEEGSRIEMSVHCEASKEACDDLVRAFAELNGQTLP